MYLGNMNSVKIWLNAISSPIHDTVFQICLNSLVNIIQKTKTTEYIGVVWHSVEDAAAPSSKNSG